MTNNPFYVCEKYYLLIYETKEDASPPNPGFSAISDHNRKYMSNIFSKELMSTVACSIPGEPIFVVEKEDKYWHVIIGERIGWIIVEDEAELKNLKGRRIEPWKNQIRI